MSRMHPSCSRRTGLIFRLCLMMLVPTVLGLNIDYCSSDNTAQDFPAQYNQFQSNGWCQDRCQGKYAFAVLQDSNCWCSNYAPADTTDSSDCNTKCPGFGSEQCGNSGKGLYGYYHLRLPVSGTLGASSSSSEPTSSSSQIPSTTSTSFSTSYSSSSSESSETTTSSISSRTPVTSLATITEDGATVVSTLFVTPTAEPAASPRPSSSSKGSISGGAIAGITVVVVAVIAALAFAAFFFWRKSRNSDRRTSEDQGSFTTSGEKLRSDGGQQRFDPTFGLGGSGRKSQRSSAHLTKGGVSTWSSHQDSSVSPIDRQSMTFVDQRLNPNRFGQHDSGRVSQQSLNDGQDYSRPLRVTNADDSVLD